MINNTYSINTRDYSSLLPLQEEFTLEPNLNYCFDLSYLECIDLIGEKSGEFLQGQLSCDVREVTPHSIRQGAMCNLQGRILALLDVIDWDGLHLIVPQDLSKATINSLTKTALFSKVSFKTSTHYQIIGFCLNNDKDTIPFNAALPQDKFGAVQNELFCCYHLGDGYYVFIIKLSVAEEIHTQFSQKNQWRGALAWHFLQLHQKRVEIYPESRGLFLPHRLSLQLLDYLSFNKGCYKGQEIIARTHYRAKLKHEMKLLTIQTQEKLYPGQRLLDENNGTELGEIIDFCPIDNNTFVIAASVVLNCPSTFQIEKNPK